METERVFAALEQALWTRGQHRGLIHHSDRGSQYLSLRYTQRLSDAGVDASVGSVGSSYDNALAESLIGLYKTELIGRRSAWSVRREVEHATLDWSDWLNHRRLLEALQIGFCRCATMDFGIRTDKGASAWR